jgi:hypothetical protein
MNFILILFLTFFLLILITYLLVPNDPFDIYEETETTETVTCECGSIEEFPPIERYLDNHGYFILDPHDGMKIYLNTLDDMYQDARGKYWRIT